MIESGCGHASTAVNQIIDLVSNDTSGIHIYTMNNPETAEKITDAVNAMF